MLRDVTSNTNLNRKKGNNMAKMMMKKHPDEKEDKALTKKMIKDSAKKPTAPKTKPKKAKKGY